MWLDYYKIETAAKLSGYVVKFVRWPNREFKPFEAWNGGAYASLPWYQSYNNVKHNRFLYFQEASYENVMNAIAGLLCVLHAQVGENVAATCYEGISAIQNAQDVVKTGTFTINTPFFPETEQYDFVWDNSVGAKVAVQNFPF